MAGKINVEFIMGYVKYISNPRKPSLAQLVEHGTVVKTAGIPGSPVQARNGGFCLTLHPSQHPHLYIFYRKICTTVQHVQNQDGDGTQRAFRFVVLQGIRSR